MYNKKTNQLPELMKLFTGSIMTPENIMVEYNSLTQPKRAYVYSKVHQIIKRFNIAFDKAHPILAVELSILASEEGIDPAVALLIYTDKKNRKM